MSKKNIVWLASYPKSGNTWTRIFLSNYLFNRDEPLSINEVHRLGIGDSVTKSYKLVSKGPFDPTDHLKMLALRGKVLRGIMANGADINFVKSHNLRSKAFGVELIPAHITRKAIYIIRNPLDMVISYARHYGHSLEDAAKSIGRSDNTTAGGEDSVKQYLGSWSEHVLSWTRSRDIPVHVMQYEEMLRDPEKEFSALLTGLGLDPDPARLDRAIRFSSFDEVSKQEEKEAFVERSSNNSKFFHTGKAGTWQTVLPEAVVDRIRKDHGKVMREFGYL